MLATDSLTRLLDVPLTELAASAIAGDLGLALDDLDAVVVEQALRIEGTATRAGMLAAAESLHELAEWAFEKGAGAAGMRFANRWELLGEHLTDRSARADPIGIEALLRSQAGKPRRLLAVLADAPGGSLPRAGLGRVIDAGDESHVSHILRSLYDAGLVHRHKLGREVTVTLSARGRALVDGGPLPAADARVLRPVQPLLDGLPPERRHQVQDRPTQAPVLSFADAIPGAARAV